MLSISIQLQDKDFQIYDAEMDDIFYDIDSLVKCLETLKHFTASEGVDIRERLKEVITQLTLLICIKLFTFRFDTLSQYPDMSSKIY